MAATTTTDCEPGTAIMQSVSTRFIPSIRSVLFSSCYTYSPRGGSFASAGSREICLRLKSGDPQWLPVYVGKVFEQTLRGEVLAGLLGKAVVLVPVPGSAIVADAPWAAEKLAIALQSIGLGKSVWQGVRRCFAVRKSATALNADRPTVQQHYNSFAVVRSNVTPQRMVLVDDVITKGRTILAAAVRLHEAFPNADIRAFALVRTMGFLADVAHPLQPCQGYIRWAGGDARRDP